MPAEGPVEWKLEEKAPKVRTWATDAMDRVYAIPLSGWKPDGGVGGFKQREGDRIIVYASLQEFLDKGELLDQAPLPGPPGSYKRILTSTTCAILPPKHASYPLLSISPPCEVYKQTSLGRSDVLNTVGWVECTEGCMLDMTTVSTNIGTFATAVLDDVGESLYVWGGEYEMGTVVTDLPWISTGEAEESEGEGEGGIKFLTITDGVEIWVVDNHDKIWRKPNKLEDWDLFEGGRWGDYNGRHIRQFVGGTWGFAMVVEEEEVSEVPKKEPMKFVDDSEERYAAEDRYLGGGTDKLKLLMDLERENQRAVEEVRKMMD
jgi:hypothetical protein